ncbi:MAG: acyltransferase family protein [Chlorobiaceae bacterium]|nr:acyltransferase family protein [Chlorobiaceae bacterium]
MDKRIAQLRVAACFMVVFLHVAAQSFLTLDHNWWAGNFYDSLVRSCVPLFLMISGATLIPRDEPLQQFFTKRLVRIIPPLLFWSLFYLSWTTWMGEDRGNWALAILSGPVKFHLWYFYELIGLYLFMPVLRKFFNGSSRGEQLWFIGLWIVVVSVYHLLGDLLGLLDVSWAEYFDKFFGNINFSFFDGLVGYLILGAYASRSKVDGRIGLAVFAVATACTMVGTWLLSYHLGEPSELFYSYTSPFVIAAGWGLFTFFMDREQGPPSKLVTTIGECTLGIYGLHIFIIDPVLNRNGFSVSIGNPWLTVPLVSFSVFLITFAIVYLLRLVRPLRHVI